MKYLLLITVFSFGLLSTACGQNEKTAPQTVQTAFKAKFPTVSNPQWEMEGDGEWEAEFKMNGKEMSANFKTDGTWLETETELNKSNLPAAVKKAIASKFPGMEIEEATLVEMPGKASAYEVEMEKGETTIEALFSADGKVLKQKTEKEEEEDKN